MKDDKFVPGGFYLKGYNREQALQSVGHGWARLIHKVFDKLEEYPNIIIDTVKEKWGGLRVYTSPMHEDFDKFILGLETESYNICETCGEVGTLRGGGWYKTLCDTHANNRPVINPF
jgi:hypothetical protein